MLFFILAALDFGLFILMFLVYVSWRRDFKTRIRILSIIPQKRISIEIRIKSWCLELFQNLPYPDILERHVSKKLFIMSGIKLNHSEYLSFWWFMIILGYLCCILYVYFLSNIYGIVGLLILTICVSNVGPFLYLKKQIQIRTRKIERQLPFFLDMLTYTVEAGMGLFPALYRINQAMDNYLHREIDYFLERIDLGFSVDEALRELKTRVPSQYMEQIVEAIISSRKLGTSLARTLRIQSNILRSHFRLKAEQNARTAPIRIIPALVFFFLPGLLLIYLAPPLINLFMSQ